MSQADATDAHLMRMQSVKTKLARVTTGGLILDVGKSDALTQKASCMQDHVGRKSK